MELLDSRPVVKVQESEYKRLLGFPADHELTDRARELADWAARWYAANGHPWIYGRPTPVEAGDESIRIQGAQFASKRLHDQLASAEAHLAMLVAVSAGKECEDKARELWQEGKPDEYFFLEVYGSAVVENLVTTAGARICEWAEQQGMAVLPHYSPGYSGWDVADQERLFEAMRPAAKADFPGTIRVLQSGMLEPKKSQLAVVGITRRVDRVRGLSNLLPCENCSFAPCQYRRAPYRNAFPQIEDVRRLQPGTAQERARETNGGGLERNARYSVNMRALRKWSQERLRLQFADDGTVEAVFRYEGTTCSNLGRPLEFEYRVKLGAPETAYVIQESSCQPASGDVGHTQMCEFLNDAERLMGRIERERPLAGKPLNAVLSWRRPFNPAGCYCHTESRQHKWGLVLEVVHYALVQWEGQRSGTQR